MGTLKITAKGQVTLRKDLLNHLGVRPGETVSVDKLPGGAVEVRAARPGGPISAVYNVLKRKGRRRLSVKQINDIAAAGWAGKR